MKQRITGYTRAPRIDTSLSPDTPRNPADSLNETWLLFGHVCNQENTQRITLLLRPLTQDYNSHVSNLAIVIDNTGTNPWGCSLQPMVEGDELWSISHIQKHSPKNFIIYFLLITVNIILLSTTILRYSYCLIYLLIRLYTTT